MEHATGGFCSFAASVIVLPSNPVGEDFLMDISAILSISVWHALQLGVGKTDCHALR